MDCFSVSISGGLFDVKSGVEGAMNFLDGRLPWLDESDRRETKLVICELLFNAIIHGNRSDARKKVEFSLSADGGAAPAAVRGVITDEGAGFDYKKVLRDMNGAQAITLEHGRGVKLAYELTDRLEYNAPGNSVFFHKTVRCSADSAKESFGGLVAANG